MFEGSANVGKGEHMILVENNGGDMNGTTTEDRTNYFESFASNQLDLGLFLEADRMRSLAVNQANLDNQRNAVQEERRLSYDNQPYGETPEVVQGLVFDNFANKHSVIGSMKDLNAATIQDVTVLSHLLCAEQCGPHAGGRFRAGGSAGEDQEVFRSHSRAVRASGTRSGGAQANRGASQDHRRSVRPGAPAGYRVQDSSRQHARLNTRWTFFQPPWAKVNRRRSIKAW